MDARKNEVIVQFIYYFWEDADEAIREYAQSLLVDILSNSENADISQLLELCSAQGDLDELQVSVSELQQVMKNDLNAETQRPNQYKWMKISTQNVEPPHESVPAASLAMKPKSGDGDLNIAAAEFKPSGALFDTYTEISTTCAEDLYVEDQFSNLAVDDGQMTSISSFLAVLQQQFPEYSPAALYDIFNSCGRSIPGTIDTLCRLENEIHGVHAATGSFAKQGPAAAKEPNFSSEDFPSLGGPSPGSKSKGPVVPLGVNYAGKAKAAAHLPAASTPSTSRAAAGQAAGSSAPIWQSQDVKKFSTGAAVAADYAASRATARDHARIRNMCFQEATQAYLAGNKALAKELGARGRWHNEQMKAAHAKAAESTFNARNTHIIYPDKGSKSNISGGNVPTIDLHGLHVSEARLHLEQAFAKMRRQGIEEVRVVVGVGQHGNVPARLPAAVRSFLEEWGLRYKESYAGLLEVRL